MSAGVDVRVITGWTPRATTPDWLIDGIGRLIGRTHLSNGMRKRSPEGLALNRIQAHAWPEFLQQGLFMLARAKLMSRTRAATHGWAAFGRSSRRSIHDADIFHVRTGAGRGGAIEVARKRGMAVLADHSIAHPAEIMANLAASYERFGRQIDIDPKSSFWKSVLADCNDADAVLVNSDYVKETLVAHGFDPACVFIAWLGLPQQFVGAKTNWERSDFLRLLFTGGFDLRKGAHILIESLGHLREAGCRFQLDVVGMVHPTLQSYLDVDKASDVKFHGFIPRGQLPELIQKADVYVFPSFAEGAAQSAMEAMGAGLPVVATRESGIPLRHEENGLLIPRDDSVAVASAIMRLADDEALRERLGRAGIETIEENHTWEKYAENVKQVYQLLLDNRRGTE